jgi:uncharacterized membrane protein YfcA
MILVLVAIVALAFVVEAAAGFGATIVTVALAAQLYAIPEVLATFVPVNAALSTVIVLRYRDAVEWRLLARRVLPLMGAGAAVGLALFQLRDLGFLRVAFALFVVAIAAWSLARRRTGATRLAGPALFGAGVVHRLFATGGPLAVYALAGEIPDKTRFRTTLAMLWLTFNGVLIGSYVASGELTAHTLRGSLWLVPAVPVGLVVGDWLHHRVNAETFRVVVNVLLLVAGVVLLVRSL